MTKHKARSFFESPLIASFVALGLIAGLVYFVANYFPYGV